MLEVSKRLTRGTCAALASVTFAAAIGATSSAHAAGIEDTVGGAVGLGRAAYFARVNDFMAVLQNPANLAVIPGGTLGLELRLPVLAACYDRAADQNVQYKQDPPTGQVVESFGQVCNSATPAPTANIGYAQSYDTGWGWGVGLFTPAASGNSKYGSDVNRSVYPLPTEVYRPTLTGTQSPTRQMGVEREGALAFLMVGLGAQPTKILRFGLSAGLGFGSVYNKSFVSVQGGTFRDQEVVNEISVVDYAIPKATSSFVLSPADSFDLFGALAYQGDINGKGHADLTANGIKGAPRKDCRDPNPGTSCRLDGIELHVPFQTIELTFGARYAYRRVARERVLDPMKDEVFDIEVDANWAETSRVDSFDVTLHDDQVTNDRSPKVQFGNGMGASTSYIRKTTGIPKNWKDTWTVRAGTDVNVIRERLTLRAGGSFATRATPIGYMNIDYFPVQKIGAHLGATLRFGKYNLHAGYAHLFFEEINVPVGKGLVKDIATIDEAKSTAVNEGRFIGGLDVFSLQVNATF